MPDPARSIPVRPSARVCGAVFVLCLLVAAIGQAAKAQQSENPNYALAGVWLEVLSYSDQRDEAKARALFPTVVEKDWNVENEAQAEETMRGALTKLMDIRETHKLPRVCPA